MRARSLLWFVFLAAGVTGACGYHLSSLGIRANSVGYVRVAIGPSPENIQRQLHLGLEEVDETVAARLRADAGARLASGFRADIVGDEGLEWVIGGGSKKCHDGGWSGQWPSAITIATTTGEWLQTVCRGGPGSVYGYGTIRPSQSDKHDLLLCSYPVKGHTSRFELRSLSGERIIATWDEHPATCAFAVGAWNEQDAVFILQQDDLLIKSPQGDVLFRTTIPDAHAFNRVAVVSLNDGSTVFVASGNGYTNLHMVAVINRAGELTFHEVEEDRAYRLEVTDDGGAFEVWTRSTVWAYVKVKT